MCYVYGTCAIETKDQGTCKMTYLQIGVVLVPDQTVRLYTYMNNVYHKR